MTFRSVLRGVSLGMLVLLSACAWMEPHLHIEGSVQEPNWSNPGTVFKVGAARVDITPIPGFAMSYKFDGRVSRGFWTRLYARAIYFEDKNGKAMVFVSCEIPCSPPFCQDRGPTG